MGKVVTPRGESEQVHTRAGRPLRADAQRNLLVLLKAAKEVFARSGVDAPVREIADRAGVGVGTVYRHFPRRPDLVAAVFRQEMDACADAVDALPVEHAPFEALSEGMQLFAEFAATKRGLAEALHSGDPAFDALPARREQGLRPAFARLFQAAMAAGVIRHDIDAVEFLDAAARLCTSVYEAPPDYVSRMVALLVDGLRHQADRTSAS